MGGMDSDAKYTVEKPASAKEKDLKAIKEHWSKEETVSLKDKYLQELERSYILEEIKKINPKLIADIGCGDCSDTIHYCKYAEMVYAYDYSTVMLKKTAEYKCENLQLKELDFINQNIDVQVDLVITKRCLINFGSFENQKKAIEKIYDSLNKDGYYLMLECSYEGLNNLNRYREVMKLRKIEEPAHNVHFNMEELKSFVERSFHVKKISFFPTYYFLTRVYNQLIDGRNYEKYDFIAKEICDNLDLFNNRNIGPQFMMVLQRRDKKL
jgi:hypothetical protein